MLHRKNGTWEVEALVDVPGLCGVSTFVCDDQYLLLRAKFGLYSRAPLVACIVNIDYLTSQVAVDIRNTPAWAGKQLPFVFDWTIDDQCAAAHGPTKFLVASHLANQEWEIVSYDMQFDATVSIGAGHAVHRLSDDQVLIEHRRNGYIKNLKNGDVSVVYQDKGAIKFIDSARRVLYLEEEVRHLRYPAYAYRLQSINLITGVEELVLDQEDYELSRAADFRSWLWVEEF
jgi:hypothetical protein